MFRRFYPQNYIFKNMGIFISNLIKLANVQGGEGIYYAIDQNNVEKIVNSS